MTIDPFQTKKTFLFFGELSHAEKGQPPFPKMYPDTKLLRPKAFGLCPRAQQMLQGLRNLQDLQQLYKTQQPPDLKVQFSLGKQQELEKRV